MSLGKSSKVLEFSPQISDFKAIESPGKLFWSFKVLEIS